MNCLWGWQLFFLDPRQPPPPWGPWLVRVFSFPPTWFLFLCPCGVLLPLLTYPVEVIAGIASSRKPLMIYGGQTIVSAANLTEDSKRQRCFIYFPTRLESNSWDESSKRRGDSRYRVWGLVGAGQTLSRWAVSRVLLSLFYSETESLQIAQPSLDLIL